MFLNFIAAPGDGCGAASAAISLAGMILGENRFPLFRIML